MVFTLNFGQNFFHIRKVLKNQDWGKSHKIWRNRSNYPQIFSSGAAMIVGETTVVVADYSLECNHAGQVFNRADNLGKLSAYGEQRGGELGELTS